MYDTLVEFAPYVMAVFCGVMSKRNSSKVKLFSVDKDTKIANLENQIVGLIDAIQELRDK